MRLWLPSGPFVRRLAFVDENPEATNLLVALERALLPLPEVQAALLFGSHATGRAKPESDIDIAVLLDEAPEPSKRKALLRNLIAALGERLRADRLDLVILNDAPPKLAFHVLKDGKLAFERDRGPLHRFRVATYRRHADYEPVERFFRRITKARAQQEAAHG